MAGMLANLNPIGRPIAGLHQPMAAFLETVVEPVATQRVTILILPFAMPSHMPVEPVTDAHLRGDAVKQQGRRLTCSFVDVDDVCPSLLFDASRS